LEIGCTAKDLSPSFVSGAQVTLSGHLMIFLVRYDIMYYYIPQSHPKQQMIHFSSPSNLLCRIKIYPLHNKKKGTPNKSPVSQSIACLPACPASNDTTLQITRCPSCFQIAQQLSRWNSLQTHLSNRWCPRRTNISLPLPANPRSDNPSDHQEED
jgi:hypothetical protein